MSVKRYLWWIIPTSLLVIAYLVLWGSGFTGFQFDAVATPAARSEQAAQTGSQERAGPAGAAEIVLMAGSAEKFEYLYQQRSSRCSLKADEVLAYDDEQHIQGSCCSRMDLHRYQEQVEGLEKYASISQVPNDPYDIPASLAKELFRYQQEIELTEAQQQVYDEAMEMSDEGGPCCCKCWRWIAFEGLAKFLITEHNFDAPEIAQVWDLADGCGGSGHNHGDGGDGSGHGG